MHQFIYFNRTINITLKWALLHDEYFYFWSLNDILMLIILDFYLSKTSEYFSHHCHLVAVLKLPIMSHDLPQQLQFARSSCNSRYSYFHSSEHVIGSKSPLNIPCGEMILSFLLDKWPTTKSVSKCRGRYSQTLQGLDWDKQDLLLDVPLRCIQQGKRDVRCHYAAMGPNGERILS